MSSFTSHNGSISSLAKVDSKPDGRLSSSSTSRTYASDAEKGRAQADDRRPSVYDEGPRGWPNGWRPWASLLGGFFLMFNSWGIINAYGTFLSFYQEVLLPETDPLLLNLVGATQCFMILSLSFIIGRIVDASYIRYLTVGGSILVMLGTFLLSIAQQDGSADSSTFVRIWVYQGLITGLGMACFFVTSSQVVATYFNQRKGFAIGVVASGASISGLVYPFVLRFIIDSKGFDTAVRYFGLVCGVTCLLACILVHQSANFEPRRPESWLRTKVWIDPTAFRHPAFLLFTLAIAMMFFGFYGIFFNLEEWAARTGVAFRGNDPPTCPPSLAPGNPAEDPQGCTVPGMRSYYLLAIMNGSSTIGRLSSSYLSDIFGALNVHATVTAVAAILCLALWTNASSLAAALAFVVLFGAFSGSVIGLPPASMASILGPRPEDQRRLGQWTGMMYTCAAPFALTGPVIEGYLIQRYGYNFITIQVFSGVCLLLSACLMAAASYVSRDGRRKYQEHE